MDNCRENHTDNSNDEATLVTEGRKNGASNSIAPGMMLERWEVLELIGEGGMSTVYRAQHAVMGKLAAVKLLHANLMRQQSSLQRFQLEARAASTLNHPNVISVFDCGITDDGRPFQIMEYLEGQSLTELLASSESKRLPMERALGLFCQICDALAHAHSKGVVHRDLKPSNVVIVKDQNGDDLVKIVDFGIAKLLPLQADAVELHQLTITGDVFGTPKYMSPEQCQGQKPDGRSDVYSMGCLMYEVLTGKPPFSGATVLDTMYAHIDSQARPFAENEPETSPLKKVEAIVLKALSKERDDRYQSMTELKDALGAAISPVASRKRFPVQAAIASGVIVATVVCPVFLIFLIKFSLVKPPAQTDKNALVSDTRLSKDQRLSVFPDNTSQVLLHAWSRFYALPAVEAVSESKLAKASRSVKEELAHWNNRDSEALTEPDIVMLRDGCISALKDRAELFMKSGNWEKAASDFENCIKIRMEKGNSMDDSIAAEDDADVRWFRCQQGYCEYLLVCKKELPLTGLKLTPDEINRLTNARDKLNPEILNDLEARNPDQVRNKSAPHLMALAEIELTLKKPGFQDTAKRCYSGVAAACEHDVNRESPSYWKSKWYPLFIQSRVLLADVDRVYSDGGRTRDEAKNKQIVRQALKILTRIAADSAKRSGQNETEKAIKALKQTQAGASASFSNAKAIYESCINKPSPEDQTFKARSLWARGLLRSGHGARGASSDFTEALSLVKDVPPPKGSTLTLSMQSDYLRFLEGSLPLSEDLPGQEQTAKMRATAQKLRRDLLQGLETKGLYEPSSLWR